jgi:hypothetical protein
LENWNGPDDFRAVFIAQQKFLRNLTSLFQWFNEHAFLCDKFILLKMCAAAYNLYRSAQ